MKAVVSNCLLARSCRYDGGHKANKAVMNLVSKLDEVVGTCPEVESGFSTPRTPTELLDGRLIAKTGEDLTEQVNAAARRRLAEVRRKGITLAVLKSKSPTCGTNLIYDGTFSKTLIEGDGIFSALLKKEGICVVDEHVVEQHKPSVEHPVAIMLGSGLGHLADLVKPVRHIDYRDIPDFPASALPVEGHAFRATIGTIDGVPVVVYPGRLHLYQGYDAFETTSLVRHAASLGCKDVIFACATGAVVSQSVGMGVIVDQINLTGTNPLLDKRATTEIQTPFISMAEAYSSYMISLLLGVAEDNNIRLKRGILAGTTGPTFETAAEVNMLSLMGVSYVGMSVVNEVIMANALGMNVLGITQAGNTAGDPRTNHETILKASKEYQEDFEKLVRGFLHLL